MTGLNPENASYLNPTGTVGLTAAALKTLSDFVYTLKQLEPSTDWIGEFSWDISFRGKSPGSSTWIDYGPGISLGSGVRRDYPADRVTEIAKVAYATSLPLSQLRPFRKPILDQIFDGKFKIWRFVLVEGAAR